MLRSAGLSFGGKKRNLRRVTVAMYRKHRVAMATETVRTHSLTHGSIFRNQATGLE